MRSDPSPPYKLNHRVGLNAISPGERQRQKEALTQASDHARYLCREIKDLPVAISHIVELICMALDNLIEAERRALRPPSQSDADGTFSAGISASLKEQAAHQIESALSELKSGLR